MAQYKPIAPQVVKEIVITMTPIMILKYELRNTAAKTFPIYRIIDIYL